ncbi:hypothetical protein AVEN_164882-1 [Araneus ventricosus]|uniref:Uncharacterized protein n=1 Tax=Araneus ventricosus TaxID=182803 RepID=A0A4Y2DSW5_ARAVE|nr:hypothetical protein AVEN_164882-1 [Araneus ventricosus]
MERKNASLPSPSYVKALHPPIDCVPRRPHPAISSQAYHTLTVGPSTGSAASPTASNPEEKRGVAAVALPSFLSASAAQDVSRLCGGSPLLCFFGGSVRPTPRPALLPTRGMWEGAETIRLSH